MKKRLLITIAIALLGLVSVAFAAEPVPPAPPPTAKEIATAVKEKMGDIPGALNRVKGKIAEFDNTFKAEVHSLDRLVVVTREMTVVVDNGMKNANKKIDSTADRIIGFVGAGVALILLAIAAVIWFVGAARKDIRVVAQAVDKNPERVAETLGKPANATLVFKVTGKALYEVTHFVTRRGGSYPSLFVTEDGASRKFYEKPWETRDSDKSAMKSYLFGDIQTRNDPQAVMQVKLIKSLDAGDKSPEELKKLDEWISIRKPS